MHTYQWDAENHLKSVDNGTNGTFTYNAYGWRVYSSLGTVSFLYDPSGQMIGGNWANGTGWNAGIRFGSRLFAMYGGDGSHSVYFTHANALDSETQTTDYAGNGGQPILFFPYGQKMSVSSTLYPNTVYQFFAGLQLYDTSTDGYVPPARYYIPEQGRWLTPDPAGKGAVHIDDPQTWNMYAYARNNPTTLNDPSGLESCCDTSDVVNFVLAAGNAYASDNLLGAYRVAQDTTAGKIGAAVGDAAATISAAGEVVEGAGGEIAGLALDATGVGASVGVPANVVSTAVMAHGALTGEQGLVHLARAGDFTRGEKNQIDAANAAKNGGTNYCDNCGKPIRQRVRRACRPRTTNFSDTMIPRSTLALLRTSAQPKYSAPRAISFGINFLVHREA